MFIIGRLEFLLARLRRPAGLRPPVAWFRRPRLRSETRIALVAELDDAHLAPAGAVPQAADVATKVVPVGAVSYTISVLVTDPVFETASV